MKLRLPLALQAILLASMASVGVTFASASSSHETMAELQPGGGATTSVTWKPASATTGEDAQEEPDKAKDKDKAKGKAKGKTKDKDEEEETTDETQELQEGEATQTTGDLKRKRETGYSTGARAYVGQGSGPQSRGGIPVISHFDDQGKLHMTFVTGKGEAFTIHPDDFDSPVFWNEPEGYYGAFFPVQWFDDGVNAVWVDSKHRIPISAAPALAGLNTTATGSATASHAASGASAPSFSGGGGGGGWSPAPAKRKPAKPAKPATDPEEDDEETDTPTDLETPVLTETEVTTPADGEGASSALLTSLTPAVSITPEATAATPLPVPDGSAGQFITGAADYTFGSLGEITGGAITFIGQGLNQDKLSQTNVQEHATITRVENEQDVKYVVFNAQKTDNATNQYWANGDNTITSNLKIGSADDAGEYGVWTSNGFSGSFVTFEGKVIGTGTIGFNNVATHLLKFTGDVSEFAGQVKIVNSGGRILFTTGTVGTADSKFLINHADAIVGFDGASTVRGTISGTGKVAIGGNSDISFTNTTDIANLMFGNITIASGNGNTRNLNARTGGTATFTSGTIGTISGNAGTFRKDGTGKLTLSGDNSAARGAVTAKAGELILQGNNTGWSSFSVEDGATLTLTSAATFANTITVKDGGLLSMAGDIAWLTDSSATGTVAMESGGRIKLGDSYTTGATYNFGGKLTGFESSMLAGLSSRQTAEWDTSTGVLTIYGATLTWNGGATGTWDTSTENTAWLDAHSDTQYFATKDIVIFNTAGAQITVDGTVNPGPVTVNAATTFSGGTLETARLELAASLTLNGTTLTTPTINVSGTAAISGNDLSFTGAGTVLNMGGDLTVTGAMGVAEINVKGDSTLAGSVNATNMNLGGGHTLTVDSGVSASNVKVAANQSGTLAASETYNKTTNVSVGNGGTLTLGDNVTLTVDGSHTLGIGSNAAIILGGPTAKLAYSREVYNVEARTDLAEGQQSKFLVVGGMFSGDTKIENAKVTFTSYRHVRANLTGCDVVTATADNNVFITSQNLHCLTIAGGTFVERNMNVANTLTVDSLLVLGQGSQRTHDGTDAGRTLTVNGTATISSGTNHTIRVTDGYTVSIAQGATMTAPGTLELQNGGGLTIDMTGRVAGGSSAIIDASAGTITLGASSTIDLLNYGALANGKYNLIKTNAATADTIVGMFEGYFTSTAQQNYAVSHNNGLVQLVISAADTTAFTVTTNTEWVHDIAFSTDKPVTVEDGIELKMVKGASLFDASSRSSLGDITLGTGSTFRIGTGMNEEARTILTTDKPVLESHITLGQDSRLITEDGGWYFQGGLTVAGDATVINNWCKGWAYGVIDGVDATTDAGHTLTFAPVNNDGYNHQQVISFKEDGTFAGTVELKQAANTNGKTGTVRYVIDAANAFQNAEVKLTDTPELAFDVSTANIRKLSGMGKLMANANAYSGNYNGVTTLNVAETSTFSGTVGAKISLVMGADAALTLSGATVEANGSVTGSSITLDNTTVAGTINVTAGGRASLTNNSAITGTLSMDLTGATAGGTVIVDAAGGSISHFTATNVTELGTGTYNLITAADEDTATAMAGAFTRVNSTGMHRFDATTSGATVQLAVSYGANTSTTWHHDANLDTAPPVLISDGATLTIDKGASAIGAGTVVNLGEITLQDTGTTLKFDAASTLKSQTVLGTDKVDVASHITLGEGTKLMTNDGSWYFHGGITVTGNATVTNQWGKGVAYDSISGSGSPEDERDITLTFAPDNSDNAGNASKQVITFKADGNFGGTVELKAPTHNLGGKNQGDTYYVSDATNAFRNAEVKLNGANLAFDVESANFRKLSGTGILGVNNGAHSGDYQGTTTLTLAEDSSFAGTVKAGMVIDASGHNLELGTLTIEHGASLTATSVTGTGALTLDYAGLNEAATSAYLTAHGGVTGLTAINITNYSELAAGTYDLVSTTDASAEILAGITSALTNTTYKGFTVANNGGLLQLTVTNLIEHHYTTDTTLTNNQTIPADIPVIIGGEGTAVTLKTGDNTTGNTTTDEFTFGDITVENGSKLNVHLNAAATKTILKTDKMAYGSRITLEGGATLLTQDGSYYFSKEIVVKGNATIKTQWARGIVYEAINGVDAATDAGHTLKFAPVSTEGQLITFSGAGTFGGTVELNQASTNGKSRYVIDDSNAFQNAVLDMKANAKLGLNQAEVNLRGLSGVSTATIYNTADTTMWTGSGMDSGSTHAAGVELATIYITGDANGTFSGTLGADVNLNVQDGAKQTLSGATVGGTITNAGELTLSGMGDLDFTKVRNEGTINFSGGNTNLGTSAADLGGTLKVLEGGQVTVTADLSRASITENAGTLVLAQGGSVNLGNLNNTGTLGIAGAQTIGGTIGGTVSVQSTGDLTLADTANLTGTLNMDLAGYTTSRAIVHLGNADTSSITGVSITNYTTVTTKGDYVLADGSEAAIAGLAGRLGSTSAATLDHYYTLNTTVNADGGTLNLNVADYASATVGEVYTWGGSTDQYFHSGTHIVTKFVDGDMTKAVVVDDKYVSGWTSVTGTINTKIPDIFAHSTDNSVVNSLRFAPGYGEDHKTLTILFDYLKIGSIIVEEGATGYSIVPAAANGRSMRFGKEGETANSVINENFSITLGTTNMVGTQNLSVAEDKSFSISNTTNITGTVNKTGAGTFAVATGNVNEGGTVNLQEGTLQSSTLNVNAGGTVNQSGGTVTASNTLDVKGGRYNLSGGSINTVNHTVSVNANGVFDMTGGNLTTSWLLLHSADNSSSTGDAFNLKGGVLNVTATGNGANAAAVVIGQKTGGIGTVTVTGGVMNVLPGRLMIGYGGAGNMSITGGEVNAQTLDIRGNFTLGGAGRLNLGTGGVIRDGGTWNAININGGTLGTLNSANVDFSQAATLAVTGEGNTFTVDSQVRQTNAFGATTQTANGGTITISGDLSGKGDIEKIGKGKLVLGGNNTATGTLIIREGELEIRGDGANGWTAANVVSGATMTLAASCTRTNVEGITNYGTLQLGTNSILTANQKIAGNGAVVVLGGGNLTSHNAKGLETAGKITVNNNGVLDLSDGFVQSANQHISNNGTIILGGTVALQSAEASLINNIGTITLNEGIKFNMDDWWDMMQPTGGSLTKNITMFTGLGTVTGNAALGAGNFYHGGKSLIGDDNIRSISMNSQGMLTITYWGTDNVDAYNADSHLTEIILQNNNPKTVKVDAGKTVVVDSLTSTYTEKFGAITYAPGDYSLTKRGEGTLQVLSVGGAEIDNITVTNGKIVFGQAPTAYTTTQVEAVRVHYDALTDGRNVQNGAPFYVYDAALNLYKPASDEKIAAASLALYTYSEELVYTAYNGTPEEGATYYVLNEGVYTAATAEQLADKDTQLYTGSHYTELTGATTEGTAYLVYDAETGTYTAATEAQLAARAAAREGIFTRSVQSEVEGYVEFNGTPRAGYTYYVKDGENYVAATDAQLADKTIQLYTHNYTVTKPTGTDGTGSKVVLDLGGSRLTSMGGSIENIIIDYGTHKITSVNPDTPAVLTDVELRLGNIINNDTSLVNVQFAGNSGLSGFVTVDQAGDNDMGANISVAAGSTLTIGTATNNKLAFNFMRGTITDHGAIGNADVWDHHLIDLGQDSDLVNWDNEHVAFYYEGVLTKGIISIGAQTDGNDHLGVAHIDTTHTAELLWNGTGTAWNPTNTLSTYWYEGTNNGLINGLYDHTWDMTEAGLSRFYALSNVHFNTLPANNAKFGTNSDIRLGQDLTVLNFTIGLKMDDSLFGDTNWNGEIDGWDLSINQTAPGNELRTVYNKTEYTFSAGNLRVLRDMYVRTARNLTFAGTFNIEAQNIYLYNANENAQVTFGGSITTDNLTIGQTGVDSDCYGIYTFDGAVEVANDLYIHVDSKSSVDAYTDQALFNNTLKVGGDAMLSGFGSKGFTGRVDIGGTLTVSSCMQIDKDGHAGQTVATSSQAAFSDLLFVGGDLVIKNGGNAILFKRDSQIKGHVVMYDGTLTLVDGTCNTFGNGSRNWTIDLMGDDGHLSLSPNTFAHIASLCSTDVVDGVTIDHNFTIEGNSRNTDIYSMAHVKNLTINGGKITFRENTAGKTNAGGIHGNMYVGSTAAIFMNGNDIFTGAGSDHVHTGGHTITVDGGVVTLAASTHQTLTDGSKLDLRSAIILAPVTNDQTKGTFIADGSMAVDFTGVTAFGASISVNAGADAGHKNILTISDKTAVDEQTGTRNGILNVSGAITAGENAEIRLTPGTHVYLDGGQARMAGDVVIASNHDDVLNFLNSTLTVTQAGQIDHARITVTDGASLDVVANAPVNVERLDLEAHASIVMANLTGTKDLDTSLSCIKVTDTASIDNAFNLYFKDELKTMQTYALLSLTKEGGTQQLSANYQNLVDIYVRGENDSPVLLEKDQYELKVSGDGKTLYLATFFGMIWDGGVKAGDTNADGWWKPTDTAKNWTDKDWKEGQTAIFRDLAGTSSSTVHVQDTIHVDGIYVTAETTEYTFIGEGTTLRNSADDDPDITKNGKATFTMQDFGNEQLGRIDVNRGVMQIKGSTIDFTEELVVADGGELKIYSGSSLAERVYRTDSQGEYELDADGHKILAEGYVGKLGAVGTGAGDFASYSDLTADEGLLAGASSTSVGRVSGAVVEKYTIQDVTFTDANKVVDTTISSGVTNSGALTLAGTTTFTDAITQTEGGSTTLGEGAIVDIGALEYTKNVEFGTGLGERLHTYHLFTPDSVGACITDTTGNNTLFTDANVMINGAVLTRYKNNVLTVNGYDAANGTITLELNGVETPHWDPAWGLDQKKSPWLGHLILDGKGKLANGNYMYFDNDAANATSGQYRYNELLTTEGTDNTGVNPNATSIVVSFRISDAAGKVFASGNGKLHDETNPTGEIWVYDTGSAFATKVAGYVNGDTVTTSNDGLFTDIGTRLTANNLVTHMVLADTDTDPDHRVHTARAVGGSVYVTSTGGSGTYISVMDSRVTVDKLIGGNVWGDLHGDTNVYVHAGAVGTIIGGGQNGGVENINITVDGGSVTHVWGSSMGRYVNGDVHAQLLGGSIGKFTTNRLDALNENGYIGGDVVVDYSSDVTDTTLLQARVTNTAFNNGKRATLNLINNLGVDELGNQRLFSLMDTQVEGFDIINIGENGYVEFNVLGKFMTLSTNNRKVTLEGTGRVLLSNSTDSNGNNGTGKYWLTVTEGITLQLNNSFIHSQSDPGGYPTIEILDGATLDISGIPVKDGGGIGARVVLNGHGVDGQGAMYKAGDVGIKSNLTALPFIDVKSNASIGGTESFCSDHCYYNYPGYVDMADGGLNHTLTKQGSSTWMLQRITVRGGTLNIVDTSTVQLTQNSSGSPWDREPSGNDALGTRAASSSTDIVLAPNATLLVDDGAYKNNNGQTYQINSFSARSLSGNGTLVMNNSHMYLYTEAANTDFYAEYRDSKQQFWNSEGYTYAVFGGKITDMDSTNANMLIKAGDGRQFLSGSESTYDGTTRMDDGILYLLGTSYGAMVKGTSTVSEGVLGQSHLEWNGGTVTLGNGVRIYNNGQSLSGAVAENGVSQMLIRVNGLTATVSAESGKYSVDVLNETKTVDGQTYYKLGDLQGVETVLCHGIYADGTRYYSGDVVDQAKGALYVLKTPYTQVAKNMSELLVADATKTVDGVVYTKVETTLGTGADAKAMKALSVGGVYADGTAYTAGADLDTATHGALYVNTSSKATVTVTLSEAATVAVNSTYLMVQEDTFTANDGTVYHQVLTDGIYNMAEDGVYADGTKYEAGKEIDTQNHGGALYVQKAANSMVFVTLSAPRFDDATYSGVLSDAQPVNGVQNKGSLVKVGLGTLTIDQYNAYTGGTDVRAGTLNVQGWGLLGGTNSKDVDQTAGASLMLSYDGSYGDDECFFINTDMNITGRGDVRWSEETGYTAALISNVGKGFNANTNFTLAGTIAGDGNVLHMGKGTLYIDGWKTEDRNGVPVLIHDNTASGNTYTGGTTVTNGRVFVRKDAGLGATADGEYANLVTLKGTEVRFEDCEVTLAAIKTKMKLYDGNSIEGKIVVGTENGTIRATGAVPDNGTMLQVTGDVEAKPTVLTIQGTGYWAEETVLNGDGSLVFQGGAATNCSGRLKTEGEELEKRVRAGYLEGTGNLVLSNDGENGALAVTFANIGTGTDGFTGNIYVQGKNAALFFDDGDFNATKAAKEGDCGNIIISGENVGVVARDSGVVIAAGSKLTLDSNNDAWKEGRTTVDPERAGGAGITAQYVTITGGGTLEVMRGHSADEYDVTTTTNLEKLKQAATITVDNVAAIEGERVNGNRAKSTLVNVDGAGEAVFEDVEGVPVQVRAAYDRVYDADDALNKVSVGVVDTGDYASGPLRLAANSNLRLINSSLNLSGSALNLQRTAGEKVNLYLVFDEEMTYHGDGTTSQIVLFTDVSGLYISGENMLGTPAASYLPNLARDAEAKSNVYVFKANEYFQNCWQITENTLLVYDTGAGVIYLDGVIPEPTTSDLALLGLAGLAARRRRKK